MRTHLDGVKLSKLMNKVDDIIFDTWENRTNINRKKEKKISGMRFFLIFLVLVVLMILLYLF